MKELSDYSHEGLALVSKASLAILAHNATFRDLTPSASEELNRSLSDVIPAERLLELKSELAAGKQEWGYSCNIKPPKGRPIPVRLMIEIPKEDPFAEFLVVRITDERENVKRDLLMKSVGKMLDLNRKRVEESKKNFKTMLDRLPQGFFTFDSQGTIGQDCSARVDRIFGQSVVNRGITEVLPIPPSEFELIQLIFTESNPSVYVDLLSREFHLEDKIVEASFTPLIEDDRVTSVMVALTDVTDYRALREALDRNTQIAKTLITVLSAKRDFIETLDLLDSLVDSVDSPLEMKLKVHTLKGTFSFLACADLAQMCHRWETEWHSVGYTSESGNAFVSAIQESVDMFLKEHEEILKIHRGEGVSDITLESERLLELFNRIRSSPVDDTCKDEILESIESLLSPKLQETLGWLEKSWADSLSKCSKPISPIVWKTSLSIYPGSYRELFGTFLHITRNAAAHGIEPPEERIASGKPPAGCFSISAWLEGNNYRIVFSDDGRGINSEAIVEAAYRKGIIADPTLRGHDALQIILRPDFSIQDLTNELSGRGFGLYAVQHAVSALGGTIEVDSQLGRGTSLTITFPKLPLPATSKAEGS